MDLKRLYNWNRRCGGCNFSEYISHFIWHSAPEAIGCLVFELSKSIAYFMNFYKGLIICICKWSRRCGGEPQSCWQRLCQHWEQPNGIHWGHLQLYILHKAAKSIAKLISQLYGELQLAVCLSQGMWSKSKVAWAIMDVWQASETSHSKSSLGQSQRQYLSE